MSLANPLVVPEIQQDPAFHAQAVPDFTDFGLLSGTGPGCGWVSGAQVGVALDPVTHLISFAVSVAAGVINIGGAAVQVPATTVPCLPPNTTDRRDVVLVGSSGVPYFKAGTPCSVTNWTVASAFLPPLKPLPDPNTVLLAEVYVPGNLPPPQIPVNAGMIVDKRTPWASLQSSGGLNGVVHDGGGAVFDVKNPLFGAYGDYRTGFVDGAMTNISPNNPQQFTAPVSAPFLPTDVGKTIYVAGAGPGGSQLVTTITTWLNSANVLLAASCSGVVTNVAWSFGHDDSAAIEQAVVLAGSTGQVLVPPTAAASSYLVASSQNWSAAAFRWTGKGMLTPAPGTGLTLGQVTAPGVQLFDLTAGGWVTVANPPLDPRWFGVIVGGAHCAVGMRALAACLGAAGGELVFGDGEYDLDKPSHFWSSVNQRGLSSEGVQFKRTFTPTGRIVTDAGVAGSSATLSSVSAAFSVADVGKLVAVDAAGPNGATLYTTLTAVAGDGHSATMALAASITITNVEAIIGVGTWERVVTDGAMTAGSSVVTSATAAFTPADVGKAIVVGGAGRAGANGLYSVITGYTNPTTITILAVCAQSLTGALVTIDPNFGDLFTFHNGGGIENILTNDAQNHGSIGVPIKVFLDDRGSNPKTSVFTMGKGCRLTSNDSVGDWAGELDFDGTNNSVPGGPGERRLFILDPWLFGSRITGRTWKINGVTHMTVLGGGMVPAPVAGVSQGIFILDTVYVATGAHATNNIQFEGFEGIFDLVVVGCQSLTYFGGNIGSGNGAIPCVTTFAAADRVLIDCLRTDGSANPQIGGTFNVVKLATRDGGIQWFCSAGVGFTHTGAATFVQGALNGQVEVGAVGPGGVGGIAAGTGQVALLYAEQPSNGVWAVPPGNTFKTGRGPTTNRPGASTVGIGATWYDTALGKPIWSDGAVWRDAVGNAV